MEKDWNPTHFSQKIIPQLLEGGASEEQIEQLLVGNPRRFFEGGALPQL
jgi:phosphotriesterase-related protein